MTTFQADNISLEIWEPNLIVLPIPENQANASIPLELKIFITNNATSTFPYIEGILRAELIKPDGQPLQPRKLIDRPITTRQYRSMDIPPSRTIVRPWRAKLFWQNNSLQLQATISDSPEIPVNLEYVWSFESLQRGTYQLRFTYSSTDEKFLFLDSPTGEISTVEGFEIAPLTTPWLTLRLVESVGTEKKAVEVDGIRFETVLPQRRISISLAQPDIDLPLSLGLKITNNTSTAYRFVLFDSLIPELKGVEGLVQRHNSEASNGWFTPVESDFQLAIPGESITLFPRTHVIRQADGLLKLMIPVRGWDSWRFKNLQPGQYQIQLSYKSQEKYESYPQDAWIGTVYTPFVEFCLEFTP